MPKKSRSTNHALTIIDQPQRDVVIIMNGTTTPVQVDAAFRVPGVHPSISGPWSGEWDKIAWRDAATGYPCVIRRSPTTGHLSGYVAVPPGHPLHGWPSDALIGLHIAVHNSIEYAAACEHDMSEATSVCHVVEPTRSAETQVVHRNAAAVRPHDDAWWFGFECNGPEDVLPTDPKQYAEGKLLDGVTERVYRDEAFVHGECTRLAMQFAAVADGRDPIEVMIPPVLADVHAPRKAGR